MLLFRRASRSDPGFAEFSPDAESMVEQGHSPLAGVLILTIALVFAGILAWSALAEVEQVVRAEGQIEPADRVKVINHPDGGRIAGVHVAEGTRVAAGQPLITFDEALRRAELAEIEGRWQSRLAEAARLEAEIAQSAPSFGMELERTRPDLVREQLALLEERRAARASRLEELERSVERRASEVRSIAAEVERLRESRRLLEQQVEAVRELADKGLYPRLQLVSVERELADVLGALGKTRQSLNAAEAALAEAGSRREAFTREWRSRLLAELAATNAERKRLAETLERQRSLVDHLVVRAPVDGIVQDLQVTGPGQSVGSNQPLMKLVPTEGGLVVEARVADRDVGLIRVGQPARIKVRAYDFLRYGTLDGRIERIAADATPDPESGEPGYRVTIRTAQAALGASGVNVVPGMTVEVDLLVGERTILSYLTDRILRLREDAFRLG